MPQPNDLSRSPVALDQDSTIITVVEMSQSSWLVAGMLPGIERQPCKKLEPSPERLLALLHRWRDEAVKAGGKITRIALALEAGRDGFWLARWLQAREVEAHVIHPSSVAVSREHRRAKTDRLDTELLKRGFLGWLRGERGHCTMARVPTIAEEDAKRPNRERECRCARLFAPLHERHGPEGQSKRQNQGRALSSATRLCDGYCDASLHDRRGRGGRCQLQAEVCALGLFRGGCGAPR